MFKFDIDPEKYSIELENHAKELIKNEQIQLDIFNMPDINGMKMLDDIAQKIFGIILKQYDGNTDNYVYGSMDLFKDITKLSIKEIFKKLKYSFVIADFALTYQKFEVCLTNDGKSYFEYKEEYDKEKEKL